MKWYIFICGRKCGIMRQSWNEAVRMLRQKIKVYAVPLLLVLLGIILQILSETQLLDSFLSELVIEEKVATVKTAVNILGYIVFVAPLGWQSVTRGRKASACDNTIARYINEQRELVFTILSEHKYVEGSSEDLNIRVFRKRWNRLILENEDKFYTRRIEGKLSFAISKNEGLCVKAFKEKRSMLEIEDASKKEYNLTERQKVLAGDLKFVVAVPFHPDRDGKIKYVICFDSFQKIAKAGCEQGILKQCESIAYTVGSLIQ